MYKKIRSESHKQIKNIKPRLLALHMRYKMDLTQNLQVLIFGSRKDLLCCSPDLTL